MLSGPSGKGRKRQKKGEKGRFRPISRTGGQIPLKPPSVTPPFAALQFLWRDRTIHHHHGASTFGRSREGYGRYDFPVFSRMWVSTVELVTQSSTLLSGGGGREFSAPFFWAGYSWDIRDPDVGISQTKTLCKWPFSVVLDREWPGCPGIWVGTSRVWKNFMQENFELIFSYPNGAKQLHPPAQKHSHPFKNHFPKDLAVLKILRSY